MEKVYRSGRDNFALTIFAPADCTNNCKFCTSKIDYNIHKPNIENVCNAIKNIGKYNIRFKDVVISGGEPFARLDVLEKILKSIADNVQFSNLYVNTTLPISVTYKDIPFDYYQLTKVINACDLISGLNVSRHSMFDFEHVFRLEDIRGLNKPIRFNCVLPQGLDDGIMLSNFLYEYVQEYGETGSVAFRCDYRHINHDTLHSLDNPAFTSLDMLFGYQYSNSCHVCHSDIFGEKRNIMLHRGLEYSSIEFANFVEVNDIIIKQDGLILYDWFRSKIANDNVLKDLEENV